MVTSVVTVYTNDMQDAKEEVRARLNIEDVIGEYVQLKRAGRSFKGLSPFSGEKTPSFYVSPEKQIWHDFSSGRGGDVFSFVMEVEGLDFRQALELLARKAGVELSLYQGKGSQDLAKRKKRLYEANELATKYFQQNLLGNQRALNYVFKQRKLSKKIVQEFRLGYAPDTKDALVSFMKKRGFTPDEIRDAGLTNRFGGDLYRGRMMVPLMDGAGQVIGFTGRIIRDEPGAPKYLNTPQTLLYDKSRHVFGLSQAKESIRMADRAVVVEGNLDVVSSHQAGVEMVVATAGTAMTEQHLQALNRLASQICLAFDGDKAGVAATERAIPIAQTVGVELLIVTLPEGSKDPDELVQKDPALWVKVINNAEPVVDWIISQYAGREDLSTAAGKRAFTTAAVGVVRSLKDAVEQEHYLTKIAGMIDTSREALLRKMSSEAKSDDIKLKQPKYTDGGTAPKYQPNPKQDALLAVALVDEDIRDSLKFIDKTVFEGDYRQQVVEFLTIFEGQEITEVPTELQNLQEYVTMLLLNPDVDGIDWKPQNRAHTASDVLRSLQVNHKKVNTKDNILKQIEEAQASGDTETAAGLLRQLNAIIKGEK